MAKSRSPYLTRFLSDFTLGFSDGLTVPFALTAGLSSLGRADTVISAGLAELCAGSISMGIGGYLAALDELPSASSQHGKRSRSDVAGDEEELRGMLHDGGSGSTSVASDGDSTRESMDEKERGAEVRDEDLVRQHLEPLALSDSVMSEMLESLRRSPDDLSRAAARVQQQRRQVSIHDPSLSEPQLPVWPVASGLSISLGYVVGGIVPLFPYFFAATVGLALRWSIGLCLVALMAFGSGKSWVLRGEDRSWRRCLLEGSQMLVLGSLAAGAAVLCVNLVGSSGETSS